MTYGLNEPVCRPLQQGASIGLTVWAERHVPAASGTHFGIVLSGDASLVADGGTFPLRTGMYFCVPGAFTIEGGAGLLVPVNAYEGLFSVGGPIEQHGRLRYMNGCTDTVLIAPVVRGDPCLNFLHLPAGSDQALHTHPSERIGAVLSGTGTCITESDSFPLQTGDVFRIPAGAIHAFRPLGEALRVVAFHPDSDTGPTHLDHPMVNRTLVEGEPVTERPDLLTQPVTS